MCIITSHTVWKTSSFTTTVTTIITSNYLLLYVNANHGIYVAVRGQLCELISLLPPLCGSRDPKMELKLVGKCLYLLSHLPGPDLSYSWLFFKKVPACNYMAMVYSYGKCKQSYPNKCLESRDHSESTYIKPHLFGGVFKAPLPFWTLSYSLMNQVGKTNFKKINVDFQNKVWIKQWKHGVMAESNRNKEIRSEIKDWNFPFPHSQNGFTSFVSGIVFTSLPSEWSICSFSK